MVLCQTFNLQAHELAFNGLLPFIGPISSSNFAYIALVVIKKSTLLTLAKRQVESKRINFFRRFLKLYLISVYFS